MKGFLAIHRPNIADASLLGIGQIASIDRGGYKNRYARLCMSSGEVFETAERHEAVMALLVAAVEPEPELTHMSGHPVGSAMLDKYAHQDPPSPAPPPPVPIAPAGKEPTSAVGAAMQAAAVKRETKKSTKGKT